MALAKGARLGPYEIVNALGAVGIVPVAGDHVGIIRPDQPVVGIDHDSRRRVGDAGHLGRRHETNPVVIAGSAVHRIASVAGAAQRHQTRGGETDRTLPVGEEDAPVAVDQLLTRATGPRRRRL